MSNPGVCVTDRLDQIGGGLNFKRKKFLQIIQWAIQGEVKAVYVAHKDRLCRFCFDLVEQLLIGGGGQIIVANNEILSPQEELALGSTFNRSLFLKSSLWFAQIQSSYSINC